jgi:hypothetical protein
MSQKWMIDESGKRKVERVKGKEDVYDKEGNC